MDTKDIILKLRTKKGLLLEDSNISKETDGFFNEEYCKWCYADGEYMYHNMDFLLVCTYEEGGANPELVVYKKR